MASPVSDYYGCASGGVISGGRNYWPQWRRGLAIGAWTEIPATLLSSIDPKDSATHNPNYPSRAPWLLKSASDTNLSTNDGVMRAWCGGAWNDAVGDFWLPLGGGHSDYGGNESYKICIGADSPTWEMVRPPSGSTTLIAGGLPSGSTPQNSSYLLDDGYETTGVYADGRPRAIHSYRKHVYVPGVGPVLAIQGHTFSRDYNSTKKTWSMNESTGEWTYRSTAETVFAANPYGGAACYDSLRGCVYWLGEGSARICKLNVSDWTFSTIGENYSASGDTFIEHIPEHDIILNVCDYYTGDFVVRDPSTGFVSTPSVQGSGPASINGAVGMAWVSGVGLVVYLSGVTYVLAPTGAVKTDPWEWSTLSTTGTPPTETGGTYSKFGYSNRLKGIYRFTNASVKPWFLPLE